MTTRQSPRSIVTVEEFDAFIERLRATVALANRDQQILEALSRTMGAPLFGEDELGQLDEALPSELGVRAVDRGAAGDGHAVAPAPGPFTPDSLLEWLRLAPRGLLMRQLTGAFQVGAIRMARELKALRVAGMVRTTGTRANTRYHAVALGNGGKDP